MSKMKKPVKTVTKLPPNAKLKVKQAAEKIKEPSPKDTGKTDKLIANQIKESGANMMGMMAALKEEIANIRLESASPPQQWEFTFERDNKGFLKKIKATAEVDKKRLN